MKKRPGGQSISKVWAKDNGGSIPQNVFPYGNSYVDPYLGYCEKKKLKKHPARFGPFIPEFFIKFLTDEEDLVVDPFAGSCTTGSVAEQLGREWLCIDSEIDYVKGGVGRFLPEYSFKIDK